MGDKKYAFITGIFMLACLGAILALVIAIKGAGSLLEEKRHYVVEFPAGSNLSDLKAGSEVQIFGVKVGNVTSVELNLKGESPDPGIRVFITVPEKYILREGTKAQASKSITGDAWILISDTGSGGPLAEGASIEGSAVGIQAMLSKFQELIPKATRMMDDFSETAKTYTETGKKAQVLIAHIDGKVNDIVERYDKLTETGTEALAEIRDVFGDTGGDIRTSMSNISDATGTLKERLPEILEKAQETLAKASEVMGSAKEAMAKIDPILSDGKDITGDIKRLLEENRVKINRTMTSLQQATSQLKGGIEDIRAAPWRLLYEPDEKDQANLVVYAIARSYADAAENLDVAAQTLKSAMDDPRVDDEQLKLMRENLEQQYNNFEEVQAELWRRIQP